MTSEGLVNLLGGILVQPSVHPIAAEYALTALMKLSSRLPDQATRIKVSPARRTWSSSTPSHTVRCLCPSAKRIQAYITGGNVPHLADRLDALVHGLQTLVAKHAGSSDLEIQSRSCEYGRLFRFDSIRPQLLEPMPALDEATYMARFSAPAVVASGPALTVVRACARMHAPVVEIGPSGDVNAERLSVAHLELYKRADLRVVMKQARSLCMLQRPHNCGADVTCLKCRHGMAATVPCNAARGERQWQADLRPG